MAHRVMRWVGVVLVLGCLSGPRAGHAQAYCPHGGQGWMPVSYASFTVTALAVAQIDASGLPDAPTNLAMALVTVENATIRFRLVGELTDTDGHELAPGMHFFLCGREMITAWRGIRTSVGSTDATVHISLFRPL